jgi:glycosyltransferase involved in cell wall biosynthesis
MPFRSTHSATPLPTCTVVVPAYNCERTIAATLDSAFFQQLSDIEVIAVDDGSTDATPAVLHQLAQDEPRLRIITQRNAGVSAARNAGIWAARANIIALLDSDDLWDTTHLATHVARLMFDPRLGVSFSTARFIDGAGNVTGQARPKIDDLAAADFLAGNPTTTCSTLVVRRDVFRDCGLFDPAMTHSEDQEWLFRVAISAWQIKGVRQALVDYRTSPRGLAADLDKMQRGFETMLERARRHAPEIVARHEIAARAQEDCYLARRAVRLGLPRELTWRYLTRAVTAQPRLLWEAPRMTLGTALLSLRGPLGRSHTMET